MKETTFKSLDIKGEYIEINEEFRVYYELITYDNTFKDKVGFNFTAVECTGWTCDGKNEFNFSPESNIEIIIEGIAYFDGVRHLYFGSEKTDNYGYFNYPNIEKIIKCLEVVKKLELENCHSL